MLLTESISNSRRWKNFSICYFIEFSCNSQTCYLIASLWNIPENSSCTWLTTPWKLLFTNEKFIYFAPPHASWRNKRRAKRFAHIIFEKFMFYLWFLWFQTVLNPSHLKWHHLSTMLNVEWHERKRRTGMATLDTSLKYSGVNGRKISFQVVYLSSLLKLKMILLTTMIEDFPGLFIKNCFFIITI